MSQSSSTTLPATRRDAVLATHREAVRELARQHNAETIFLIGSVARGDDTADSDYDFLADFSADAHLHDIVDLIDDLTTLLGGRADVVDAGGLGDRRADFLADAIPLA